MTEMQCFNVTRWERRDFEFLISSVIRICGFVVSFEFAFFELAMTVYDDEEGGEQIFVHPRQDLALNNPWCPYELLAAFSLLLINFPIFLASFDILFVCAKSCAISQVTLFYQFYVSRNHISLLNLIIIFHRYTRVTLLVEYLLLGGGGRGRAEWLSWISPITQFLGKMRKCCIIMHHHASRCVIIVDYKGNKYLRYH